MTEEELRAAIDDYNVRAAALNANVDRANRQVDKLKWYYRELYLLAALVYLSGVIAGVVLAKARWGI
jgi:hypothetical protein